MKKTISKRNGARLGQHFLMHARIAERIVHTAKLSPDSVVLEIGPGTGILTCALLASPCKKVFAVEADKALFERLQTDFADEIASGRLELIYGDIRTVDLSELHQGYVVVANIPYYITGEIVRMFLTADVQPSAMVLLIQKEVAERIARAKKESILSLSVKVFGIPHYEFTVPHGAFNPAPSVDSAVLSIRNISRKNLTSQLAEKRFFDLIHAGFAHKRKYLRKNLTDAGLLASGDIAVAEKARAEDLSLSEWLSL